MPLAQMNEYPHLWDISRVHPLISSQLDIVSQISGPSLDCNYVTTSFRNNNPLAPLGKYDDKSWQRFVLSTLVADWACYSISVDRVDFNRLLFVMHVFPEGFKTWWQVSRDGAALPIGYTAWYPISHFSYDFLTTKSDQLTDRFVAPLGTYNEGDDIYLFNFSIINKLQKSFVSKNLMKDYAQTINSIHPGRMAAITVSESGKKICKRFGMDKSGIISVEGSVEEVWAGKYGPKDL